MNPSYWHICSHWCSQRSQSWLFMCHLCILFCPVPFLAIGQGGVDGLNEKFSKSTWSRPPPLIPLLTSPPTPHHHTNKSYSTINFKVSGYRQVPWGTAHHPMPHFDRGTCWFRPTSQRVCPSRAFVGILFHVHHCAEDSAYLKNASSVNFFFKQHPLLWYDPHRPHHRAFDAYILIYSTVDLSSMQGPLLLLPTPCSHHTPLLSRKKALWQWARKTRYVTWFITPLLIPECPDMCVFAPLSAWPDHITTAKLSQVSQYQPFCLCNSANPSMVLNNR